jgi:hypothetical protein
MRAELKYVHSWQPQLRQPTVSDRCRRSLFSNSFSCPGAPVVRPSVPGALGPIVMRAGVLLALAAGRGLTACAGRNPHSVSAIQSQGG